MNIVGAGLIARAFDPYLSLFPDVTIFASGVSASSESQDRNFEREIRLLRKCAELSKHIIYFSTCSIYDQGLTFSPYVLHKKKIERILQYEYSSTIFRLPQVVGLTRSTTNLFPFLLSSILLGRRIDVWQNASRFLIDVHDVASIVVALLHADLPLVGPINIAPPFPISLPELVSLIEASVGITGYFSFVDRGSSYVINTDQLFTEFPYFSSLFHPSYYDCLIRKYIPSMSMLIQGSQTS